MHENAKCPGQWDRVVKDEGSLGSSIPVSGKSEVLLSAVGGGCGRNIPYHNDDGEKSVELGRLWCGMESSAMPGLYFVCYDCMQERN